MDNRTAVGLAVAAAGAIASTPALSTPVSVSRSVTLDTLLTQGQSTTLQFDVAGLLGDNGLAGGSLLSGELTVFGFSDAQYGPGQPEPYSAYGVVGTQNRTAYYAYYVSNTCSWWSWSCYSYSYTAYAAYTATDQVQERTRDVLHADTVADTLRVSAGAASATGSATQSTRSVGSYGNAVYDGMFYAGNDWTGNAVYAYRYSRERDVYEALSGAVQVHLSLDAVALADVATHGWLSIGATSTLGQMRLTGLSFVGLADGPPAPTMSFVPTIAPPTDGQGVPEPGTLAVAAAALAAAFAARRRQEPA